MPNVTDLRVTDWDKDGTIVKVSNVKFDDGTEAPGYDLPPGLEVGKPLPGGWEVAKSKSGKAYIKSPGGGGRGGGLPAAFRNTKEGQAAEQDSIHRSVALTQAVAAFQLTGGRVDDDILPWADMFYAWLRKSAGEVAATLPVPASPAPKSESTPATVVPGGGGTGEAPSTSGDHTHVFQSIPNVTKFERCECGETRKKEQP